MGRPKKPKPPPPPNKKTLVLRLVEAPSFGIREWLMKEYTILQNLEKLFPLEFLAQLKYSKKWDSLAVLFCDDLMRDLKNRFRAYQYVPPAQEKIVLGEKSGEDYQITRKPTLRDLLK